MKSFPCPLCRRMLEVRQTKKGKPVLICNDDCGVQMFVRYSRGIGRLEDLCARGVSFLKDFILCRSCQVAVLVTEGHVEDPLFGAAGIYCPACDRLLLEKEEAMRRDGKAFKRG